MAHATITHDRTLSPSELFEAATDAATFDEALTATGTPSTTRDASKSSKSSQSSQSSRRPAYRRITIPVGPTAFARLFAKAVRRKRLTLDTVATAAGVERGAAIKWWKGESLPAIQRLPILADVLDVPLAELCDAANRPVDEVLRAAYAGDPHGSLPGVLRSWQTTEGITAREAAVRLSIRAEEFSRWVCGSKPIPRKYLQRTADVLGMSLVEFTALAYPGDGRRHRDTRSWAQLRSRPTATLLRSQLDQLGLNERRAATAAQLPFATMVTFTSGERVPTIDESVQLARALKVDLLTLLLTAGVDAATATTVAEAVARTKGRRRGQGNALIARARQRPFVTSLGHRRSAISWSELERQTRIGRTRMIHVVQGDRTHGFRVLECIELADALDLPRERVLAGYGHHV